MLLRRDQVPFPNNPACKQCANKPCHQLFAGPIYPGKIIFVHRSKFVRLPCYTPSFEDENENKKESALLTDDLEVITGQLEISNPRWEHTDEELKTDSADKAVIGDLIELGADIKNYPEKAKVTFDIYDVSSNTPLRITSVESKNENGVAKAQWTVEDPEQKGENLKLAFEAIARSKASPRVEVPIIPKIERDLPNPGGICIHVRDEKSKLIKGAKVSIYADEKVVFSDVLNDEILELTDILESELRVECEYNGRKTQKSVNWIAGKPPYIAEDITIKPDHESSQEQ